MNGQMFLNRLILKNLSYAKDSISIQDHPQLAEGGQGELDN